MKLTTLGILPLAGVLLILAYVFFKTVVFDAAAWTGLAIGAFFGLFNLAIGIAVTRRSLDRSVEAALRALVGGFFARLLLLGGLLLWFHEMPDVNEVAFALAFMAFFVAYLALEVRMIDRSLHARRRAA